MIFQIGFRSSCVLNRNEYLHKLQINTDICYYMVSELGTYYGIYHYLTNYLEEFEKLIFEIESGYAIGLSDTLRFLVSVGVVEPRGDETFQFSDLGKMVKTFYRDNYMIK